MDYLTKWVEAFPIQDQSAETITRLLVAEVFCRQRSRATQIEVLTSWVTSSEVCKLLNTNKVNTSGYYPQTDGLVEKMNSLCY